MEDVEGCKEPGRLQEVGTKCQAGVPGFLCFNCCSGIIRVWYSLLPPAFLWLPRKGFGLSWPTFSQFVTSHCPVPASWAASLTEESKLIFSLG